MSMIDRLVNEADNASRRGTHEIENSSWLMPDKVPEFRHDLRRIDERTMRIREHQARGGLFSQAKALALAGVGAIDSYRTKEQIKRTASNRRPRAVDPEQERKWRLRHNTGAKPDRAILDSDSSDNATSQPPAYRPVLDAIASGDEPGDDDTSDSVTLQGNLSIDEEKPRRFMVANRTSVSTTISSSTPSQSRSASDSGHRGRATSFDSNALVRPWPRSPPPDRIKSPLSASQPQQSAPVRTRVQSLQPGTSSTSRMADQPPEKSIARDVRNSSSRSSAQKESPPDQQISSRPGLQAPARPESRQSAPRSDRQTVPHRDRQTIPRPERRVTAPPTISNPSSSSPTPRRAPTPDLGYPRQASSQTHPRKQRHSPPPAETAPLRPALKQPSLPRGSYHRPPPPLDSRHARVVSPPSTTSTDPSSSTAQNSADTESSVVSQGESYISESSTESTPPASPVFLERDGIVYPQTPPQSRPRYGGIRQTGSHTRTRSPSPDPFQPERRDTSPVHHRYTRTRKKRSTNSSRSQLPHFEYPDGNSRRRLKNLDLEFDDLTGTSPSLLRVRRTLAATLSGPAYSHPIMSPHSHQFRTPPPPSLWRSHSQPGRRLIPPVTMSSAPISSFPPDAYLAFYQSQLASPYTLGPGAPFIGYLP